MRRSPKCSHIWFMVLAERSLIDVATRWDIALNESLSWNEVGNISTDSGLVRDAFQLAYDKPGVAACGQLLYKFNTDMSVRVVDGRAAVPLVESARAFKHDAGVWSSAS